MNTEILIKIILYFCIGACFGITQTKFSRICACFFFWPWLIFILIIRLCFYTAKVSVFFWGETLIEVYKMTKEFLTEK